MKCSMKQLRITAALLALCLVCAGSTARAQKFGFVDGNKIISQLPEFKQINSQLEALGQRFSDTLRTMQANLQSRLDDYQRRQTMLTPDAKQKEEQTLRAMNDTVQAYQTARFGNEGTMAQLQAQYLGPIRDKVKAAVEKVARDEKMNGVMSVEMMVYYDAKLDITYKVLDALSRGN